MHAARAFGTIVGYPMLSGSQNRASCRGLQENGRSQAAPLSQIKHWHV